MTVGVRLTAVWEPQSLRGSRLRFGRIFQNSPLPLFILLSQVFIFLRFVRDLYHLLSFCEKNFQQGFKILLFTNEVRKKLV